jgi:hypothetical protein
VIELKAKLLSRIEVVEGPLDTPCHLWTGANCGGRYGHMTINGRQFMVHRLMWELHNGEITNGMWVLHRCHQKACCAIDHLMLSTPSENQRQACRQRRDRAMKEAA